MVSFLVSSISLGLGDPLGNPFQRAIGGVWELGDGLVVIPSPGLAINARRGRYDALKLLDRSIGGITTDPEFQIVGEPKVA